MYTARLYVRMYDLYRMLHGMVRTVCMVMVTITAMVTVAPTVMVMRRAMITAKGNGNGNGNDDLMFRSKEISPSFRVNQLSNTTYLTPVFFNSGE